METLVNGLVEKVGLDKDTAMKVIAFLKEHASELPTLLGKAGLDDVIPGSVSKKISDLF